MADPDFWERKRDDYSKNVYLCMRMFYVIHAILNPFIYGFFDHSFRRKLVDLVFKSKTTAFASSAQQTTV